VFIGEAHLSMKWYAFDGGKSIGQHGSEDGVIIRDEEHGDGARITLERDSTHAPYAITCGIYGWMFHTRYFGSESEAQSEFQSMRDAIDKIVAAIPMETDPDADAQGKVVAQLISEFVETFP
jgi:hypothetical protein